MPRTQVRLHSRAPPATEQGTLTDRLAAVMTLAREESIAAVYVAGRVVYEEAALPAPAAA